MAGTRTAPTVVDGSQTSIGLTVHLVDTSGDRITDFIDIDELDLSDMTALEAHVVAYQATTNASIYKVTISIEFQGAMDSDNALSAFRAEVQNGINITLKDEVAQEKQVPRVVAPVSAIMQGNQDIPLLVAPLTTLVTSYLTLLGGDYAMESMQYTGRRERKNNPKINV